MNMLQIANEKTKEVKMSEKSVFDVLSQISVEKFVKGKNGYKFLSWSDAVNELLRHYPDATWDFREWGGMPYLSTPTGCFVEASVSINGITRKQLHPILDYKNRSILEPNSFEINTSRMRALAKAISLHGMGLYIYQGEDLPPNLIDGLRDELADLLRANNVDENNIKLVYKMTNIKQLEEKIEQYKLKEKSNERE